MNKDIKKLFLVNIFLAFADGIFYNFLELWLSSNNLSINTISIVLSLGAVITISVIFLSSNLIKQSKLKTFIMSLMFIKFLILLSLFLLYQSNLNILIKFLVMIDYAIDVEICVSMYPLITSIKQSDSLYSKRRLLYEIFYYIAALISGLLLGRSISNLNITYNTYAIISALGILISFLMLKSVDINKYIKEDINNNISGFLKKVKKDKPSVYYLLFVIFNDISYYNLVGILMLILTKELNYTPLFASNIKLIFCILSVGLATLIFHKLTSKNSYINISVKYVLRLVVYFIPIVVLNSYTKIIGLAVTVLTASIYYHILDGPYINRYKGNEQFEFSNLCEMLSYFSRAVGTFLCGYCIVRTMRYSYIIAFIFTLIGAIFAYLALYSLNKERGNHDR